MWIRICFLLSVLVLIPSEGWIRPNPCWYARCPEGTTCNAVYYPYPHAKCVKEDYCPVSSPDISDLWCLDQCWQDSHCPEDDKCCLIGRCYRCVDPVDSPDGRDTDDN